MTHTTRIPISDELSNAFGKAKSEGGIRWLKVEILDEELVLIGSPHPLGGDFVADFESVQGVLQPKKPCYIVFRLDEEAKTSSGYQWLLLAYTPDGSPVKDRMLYAATRDTLKKELGRSYFSDELFGSDKEDLSYESYKAHVDDAHVGSVPLTKAEVQYRAEVSAEVHQGHTTEGVHSIKFPLSLDAQNAIQDFVEGKHNLVQIWVDTSKETVELGKVTSCDVGAVASHMPTDGGINTNNLVVRVTTAPRFTLYKYTHVFRGESHSPSVFIYTNPDGTKIRERMLYSSVKAVVTASAEVLGVNINYKFELSDIEDLTEEYFNDYIHPPERKIVKKPAFSRPTRAGGGARRKPSRKARAGK